MVKATNAYRCFPVNWLYDKLLVIEGDVADLAPWEPNLGGKLVLLLVHVEAQCIHPQPQVSTLLVPDLKVIYAVHFEILGYLEVLHHGIFPVKGRRAIERVGVTLKVHCTSTQAQISQCFQVLLCLRNAPSVQVCMYVCACVHVHV